MLRTKEFLHSVPHEFADLGTENARFMVPLKRVKKRRNLIIPMSDLAQEIVAEARELKDGKSPYIFPGKVDSKHKCCSAARAAAFALAYFPRRFDPLQMRAELLT
jgi:hypothetical protein